MKKNLLPILGCALAGACLLSGCTAAVVTGPQVVTTQHVQVVQRDPDPDQEELFSALAGDSVLGVLVLEPTQEELDLAGMVEEVFPPQELGERMLIVPRLPDSTVIVQQLNYDQEGGLTGTEEIWRSSGSQPTAVLLQQDVPEGYPTLRVVIQSGERTGSYDVTYYGRGDGRRDFYILWEREAGE